MEHLWWITTHSDVIYNILWGDKDTFMLAFASAGKADSYAQMPIPPAAALGDKGGEFHGLMAMVQHDHFGRQAWVHNTLNKHKQWAQGMPAPYTLVTGPMPEWVGTRLCNQPNMYAINATRLVLLQVEQPRAAATSMQACRHDVWYHWLQLQALGITLLPQPALVEACADKLPQPQQHIASDASSSNSAARLDELLQQQADQAALVPVQWAAVLVGRPGIEELAHAVSAPANTPAGVAELERQALSAWLAEAGVPTVLPYLNWHLMAKKKAPKSCASAGPGRPANVDGAMPAMRLRKPGEWRRDGAAGGTRLWSVLELAQVEWLPEAVRWIQGSEQMNKHVKE
ncbi:hypothetical protein OEZ86_006995 [Tetradesmus obliquus]|nr:hypothetical protein OEZ86_006995 [Tetradesmus obliquus]